MRQQLKGGPGGLGQRAQLGWLVRRLFLLEVGARGRALLLQLLLLILLGGSGGRGGL